MILTDFEIYGILITVNVMRGDIMSSKAKRFLCIVIMLLVITNIITLGFLISSRRESKSEQEFFENRFWKAYHELWSVEQEFFENRFWQAYHELWSVIRVYCSSDDDKDETKIFDYTCRLKFATETPYNYTTGSEQMYRRNVTDTLYKWAYDGTLKENFTDEMHAQMTEVMNLHLQHMDTLESFKKLSEMVLK